jgi:Polysaccharide biosynthesis/export protein
MILPSSLHQSIRHIILDISATFLPERRNLMTTHLYRSMAFVGGTAALTILLIVLAVPGGGDKPKGDTAKIRAGDRLYIHVDGTVLDHPIKGVYLVEPSGKVPLGPVYGRVEVSGLTVEMAEIRVRNHLKADLLSPIVMITRYDPKAHGDPELRERVTKLEKELAELREVVKKLQKQ